VDDALRACLVPGTVSVDADLDEADGVVLVDRSQMMQVLINLVNNATAPATGSKRVCVRAGRRSSGEAFVAVADDGCGIPPGNRSRIFEPFFTTKEQGQGTGLGLAVSYGIVKMHRGQLSVRSSTDPGQGPTGTVFTIELPRYVQSEGLAAPAPEAE